MPRKKTQTPSVWEKLNSNTGENQSRLSMVLGALIILVVGILIFNYFSKQKPTLGPSQTSEITRQQDVAPANLPGKYTVREGDTLFTIAEKYYQDGYRYTEIAKANNLTNPDALEIGQILNIPKPADSASAATQVETAWGPAITADTYTVVEGDWLSKIAGRAYGDILSFNKIAQANNIQNPDLIFPGMILKIPR